MTRCARCGEPRSEHHYNGACYGVCGKYEEARAAPRFSAMTRAVLMVVALFAAQGWRPEVTVDGPITWVTARRPQDGFPITTVPLDGRSDEFAL